MPQVYVLVLISCQASLASWSSVEREFSSIAPEIIGERSDAPAPECVQAL